MACKHCAANKEIKAVGFDFDGTLFMTEHDKAKIAADTLAFECNAKGVINDYKKMKGTGMSTKQKMKKLYEKHCGKPVKGKVEALVQAFNMQYKEELNRCPLVQCVSVLEDIKKNVKTLFLVSLTERALVVDALKHCGLKKYFTEIYAGGNKAKHFRQILRKHKLNHDEVLYVGDAQGDALQSFKTKIHFIGMAAKPTTSNILKRLGAHTTIRNLCEFPEEIIV